ARAGRSAAPRRTARIRRPVRPAETGARVPRVAAGDVRYPRAVRRIVRDPLHRIDEAGVVRARPAGARAGHAGDTAARADADVAAGLEGVLVQHAADDRARRRADTG